MIPDDLCVSDALQKQRKKERKRFWKENGMTYITSDEEEPFEHKTLRYDFFKKDIAKYRPALAEELKEIATEKKKNT